MPRRNYFWSSQFELSHVCSSGECNNSKKKKLDKNKYTFAAERNGEIVESFDFGNSPVSYDGKNFRNKSLVITTTNGTKAIEKSKLDKITTENFDNLFFK